MEVENVCMSVKILNTAINKRLASQYIFSFIEVNKRKERVSSMNMKQSVEVCFKKYVTFSGRASRSEYWWFLLFYIAVYLLFSYLIPVLINGPLISLVIVSLVPIALFLPTLSVSIRRLHDLDRSGHWYWLVFIPVIGSIIIFIWFCLKGTEGENRFGSLDS